MSSERYKSPDLQRAIKSNNPIATREFGQLGAKRSKERAEEKKSRHAQIDKLINEVKFKILEIDAQLKVLRHNEHATADGDVEPIAMIKPEDIRTLKVMYDELKLQLASLEEKRSQIR